MRHSPAQRLGDGDELALGEAERSHRPVRVGVEVELGEHGVRLAAHARAIDDGERAEAAHRQIAERDVLGDRQRRHQAQLLRDGHDAGGDGIVRTVKVALLSVDAESCRGRDDARRRGCGSAWTCRRRSRPTMAWISPNATSKSTPSSASVAPKCLLMPAALAAGRVTRKSCHQRGTNATCIFSSVNLPRSMMTSLSSATVQSRIGTS